MNVDADDVGPVLGSIAIDGGGEGQPSFALRLPDAGEGPSELGLQVAARQGPAMLAFSDTGGGRLTSEGVVQHRLETEAPGAGAGGTIDPAYRKLSRERHQRASTRTRTIQMMTDTKITNIRRPVGAERAAAAKRKSDTKRTAMDAQELQALLFRKFERQAHWAFSQLQRETAQPTPHLKAVLGEISMQAKRGPYKDMWELKKEFKTGGGGGEGGV
jgi:hypothetical protein